MKLVIQRVNKSSVIVDKKTVGSIDLGMVILVGITKTDNIETIKYLVNKVINLRIFDDSNGIMNLSIKDINGAILSISQFTLYCDTSKGNRPSYINALNGVEAIKLYEVFNEELKKENIKVETGIFGADMTVNIENNGPVTILMER